MPKFSIVGPCSKGPTFRVHAAGCGDVHKDERTYHSDKAWVACYPNVQALVAGEMADLNSQADHPNSWTAVEWHVAPCTANPDPLYGVGPMDWVLMSHLADGDLEPVQYLRREGRWVTVITEEGHPTCVDIARISQLE